MITIAYISILILVLLSVGQAEIELLIRAKLRTEAQMVRQVARREVVARARAPNIT